MITSKSVSRWLIALLAGATFSCTNASKPDWDALPARYSNRPEDSLKLAAALFLRQHGATQHCWRQMLSKTTTGDPWPVSFDTIRGEAGLDELLRRNDLAFGQELVPDGEVLTGEMLASHINSFDYYMRTWQWNRKADMRIVLNYLLAYKIFQEQPGNWREYFFRQHLHFTRKILAGTRFGLAGQNQDPMPLASQILTMSGNWHVYDAGATRAAGPPPFELMNCVRKGDCYFSAYAGVYALRSFGIPAAVDYVPAWGSKNGSHAEVAALDSTGKISAIPGHQLKNAAKVFRYSFAPVRTWTDSIRPFIGKDSFLLAGIAHDHWTDATSVHTGVADVMIEVPDHQGKRIAYICAFNYGAWQPVFYGRLTNGKTVMRDMGTGILYCAALPDQTGFRLTGRPFLLDGSGNKIYSVADPGQLQNLQLTKVNTGERSWVEKGKTYTLYSLDTAGDWQPVADIPCGKDSLLPAINIPAGGIYRLVDVSGDGRLERPFRYEKEQVWL